MARTRPCGRDNHQEEKTNTNEMRMRRAGKELDEWVERVKNGRAKCCTVREEMRLKRYHEERRMMMGCDAE